MGYEAWMSAWPWTRYRKFSLEMQVAQIAKQWLWQGAGSEIPWVDWTMGKRDDLRQCVVSSSRGNSLLEVGFASLPIVGKDGDANCTRLAQAELLQAIVQVPVCSTSSGLKQGCDLPARDVWCDQIRKNVVFPVSNNDFWVVLMAVVLWRSPVCR